MIFFQLQEYTACYSYVTILEKFFEIFSRMRFNERFESNRRQFTFFILNLANYVSNKYCFH